VVRGRTAVSALRLGLVLAMALLPALRTAPVSRAQTISPPDVPVAADRIADEPAEQFLPPRVTGVRCVGRLLRSICAERAEIERRTPPPPPPPVPRSFTLAVSGDVLPHQPVVARAATGAGYDFEPMFAPIRPVVSSPDLALCHLEVPLSPDGQDLGGYPSFNVPSELASALAATGYDGCSTASNHSLDRHLGGVVATLDVLDGAGLGHAGTARSAEEDDAVVTYEVGGVRVAHLSATYGLNGRPLPTEAPWAVDLIDPGVLLADAARARASGAEFVVVSLHWGVEYQTAPTEEQRVLAGQLLASPDIDLLVGHHAHVVQPIEWIGDELVIYGLGNSLSNQSSGCCPEATQDGMVVTVTVEEDLAGGPPGSLRVRDVLVTPTWVERSTYRILPVTQVLADPALDPGLRAELEASRSRTTEAVGPAVIVG
jgi:poly-gamma-glutamate capsule biosynthesis protein CapA/YwtB (metallophosphatase superfamily)